MKSIFYPIKSGGLAPGSVGSSKFSSSSVLKSVNRLQVRVRNIDHTLVLSMRLFNQIKRGETEARKFIRSHPLSGAPRFAGTMKTNSRFHIHLRRFISLLEKS